MGYAVPIVPSFPESCQWFVRMIMDGGPIDGGCHKMDLIASPSPHTQPTR